MIRVGILGFGGLGQAAVKLLAFKREMQLVAIADRSGFAYSEQGIDYEQAIASYQQNGSVGYLPCGQLAEDSIKALILQHGTEIDGCFLALPNLPNTFMAETAQLFGDLGWSGVLVDALKRSSAVEQLVQMGDRLAQSKITYMTGCGATPGLLTAAASLAAQSFVEVHQ
jgi:Glutamate dehydrogenase/leucine dehydrogenase